MDAAQTLLADLVARKGESLAGLSRLLGRNEAYLQQYLARGTPRRLAVADRERLARYFGVPAARLDPEAEEGAVAVPFLDVVASAGPGAAVGAERVVREEPFAPAQLKRLGVRAEAASMISVRGDPMAPALVEGDRLLVDTDARAVGREPALFVLRHEGELKVKRLAKLGHAIEVRSDNPAYETVLAAPGAVAVVGRVRLVMREA